MNLDVKAIKAQAEKELADERFRKEVEKCKAKLRSRRTLWDKLFPFKIVILRKEK